MNYSWEIIKLHTREQTNADGDALADAVVKIKWRRTGVDTDDNSAKVVGYTILSAEDVAEGDFTSFADLTEEKVVGWLNSSISSSEIEAYNLKIQESINKLVTTERAVPWS